MSEDLNSQMRVYTISIGDITDKKEKLISENLERPNIINDQNTNNSNGNRKQKKRNNMPSKSSSISSEINSVKSYTSSTTATTTSSSSISPHKSSHLLDQKRLPFLKRNMKHRSTSLSSSLSLTSSSTTTSPSSISPSITSCSSETSTSSWLVENDKKEVKNKHKSNNSKNRTISPDSLTIGDYLDESNIYRRYQKNICLLLLLTSIVYVYNVEKEQLFREYYDIRVHQLRTRQLSLKEKNDENGSILTNYSSKFNDNHYKKQTENSSNFNENYLIPIDDRQYHYSLPTTTKILHIPNNGHILRQTQNHNRIIDPNDIKFPPHNKQMNHFHKQEQQSRINEHQRILQQQHHRQKLQKMQRKHQQQKQQIGRSKQNQQNYNVVYNRLKSNSFHYTTLKYRVQNSNMLKLNSHSNQLRLTTRRPLSLPQRTFTEKSIIATFSTTSTYVNRYKEPLQVDQTPFHSKWFKNYFLNQNYHLPRLSQFEPRSKKTYYQSVTPMRRLTSSKRKFSSSTTRKVAKQTFSNKNYYSSTKRPMTSTKSTIVIGNTFTTRQLETSLMIGTNQIYNKHFTFPFMFVEPMPLTKSPTKITPTTMTTFPPNNKLNGEIYTITDTKRIVHQQNSYDYPKIHSNTINKEQVEVKILQDIFKKKYGRTLSEKMAKQIYLFNKLHRLHRIIEKTESANQYQKLSPTIISSISSIDKYVRQHSTQSMLLNVEEYDPNEFDNKIYKTTKNLNFEQSYYQWLLKNTPMIPIQSKGGLVTSTIDASNVNDRRWKRYVSSKIINKIY
ncbi:hypothetical protein SNEBB_006067 [Seison nebaliae]|nr:hypothetical protein SNEBB_006067 [Seison nebaliae]